MVDSNAPRPPLSPRARVARLGCATALLLPACTVEDRRTGAQETGQETNEDADDLGSTGGDPSEESSGNDETADSTDEGPGETGEDEGTTGGGGSCADGTVPPGEICYGPRFELLRGTAIGAVALVDLDGDGELDIVAGGELGLWLALGDGSGGFAAPVAQAISAPVLAIATADTDGDGRDELFVAADDATVRHYPGTYPLVTPAVYDVGARPRHLALAPLDAGTTLDLAVTSEIDGTLTLLVGDGLGGFGPWQDIALGGRPAAIAAAAMPDTGAFDLFVADAEGDVVSWLRNTGDGFATPTALGVGLEPTWVAVLDLDDDGRPDLLTVNASSDDLVWLPGQDGPGFGLGHSVYLGPRARAGARGDLDGDGRIDVAAVSAFDDRARFLLARDEGTAYYPVISRPVSPTPRAIATGDLDRDGVDDVVVGSAGSGGGLTVFVSSI